MDFEIFGLTISLYGLMISLGVLAALFVMVYLCKRKGYDTDIPYYLLIILFPLALIGARLYFIIFSDQLTIGQFFEFTDGGLRGLGIYGGIMFGFIGLIIYASIKKVSIVCLMDLIVPGLMLAQSIGRWGNFFNQEAYGIATSIEFFPISVFIDNGFDYGYHLATFFYESIFNFIGFWVLIQIFIKQKKSGTVTAGYLIWYGILRALVEPLRTDSLLIIPGNDLIFNRISFLVSIAMIGLGMLILYLNKKGKISQNDKQLYK